MFQIVAEGLAGRSAPSKELIVRTESQRPAGPPLEVTARPISSTEIFVTWRPPLPELRHGDIQGYNIGYSITNGPSAYNFTSSSGDIDDGMGEIILSNLQKFTKYNVIVQAFNEVGPGPLSDPLVVQTIEDSKYLKMYTDSFDVILKKFQFQAITRKTLDVLPSHHNHCKYLGNHLQIT